MAKRGGSGRACSSRYSIFHLALSTAGSLTLLRIQYHAASSTSIQYHPPVLSNTSIYQQNPRGGGLVRDEHGQPTPRTPSTPAMLRVARSLTSTASLSSGRAGVGLRGTACLPPPISLGPLPRARRPWSTAHPRPPRGGSCRQGTNACAPRWASPACLAWGRLRIPGCTGRASMPMGEEPVMKECAACVALCAWR